MTFMPTRADLRFAPVGAEQTSTGRLAPYDDHAHKGADYAREVLEELGITDANETDIICSAIWHHDSKAQVDSPMDEVLKDADVIHHSLGDPTKEVKEHEKARFAKLSEEFGFCE